MAKVAICRIVFIVATVKVNFCLIFMKLCKQKSRL
jgi:hypothetical protein